MCLISFVFISKPKNSFINKNQNYFIYNKYMNVIKDIEKTTKDVGKDIDKTTNDVIKDIRDDIKDLEKKIDSIEKNSLKMAKKIENIAEDVGNSIYNFAKDKISTFIIILLIFLFLPHILSILNFSTNLMILSKIKKSEN